MSQDENTHSLLVGYLLWIFGFLGSHRFYFGRPISGTIYFFTLGLLGIGWILLTFLGILGIHRFYLQRWRTGLIYLLTGGLFGIGVIYDFWTLNEQIDLENGRPD